MNNIDCDSISSAINAGVNYLRKSIISGKYGLACIGLDGSPKFSNDKGHLFSLFFFVRALGSDLNEIERSIILTRILSESYDGKWGYSPRGYYKESDPNPFFTDADDTAFALRTLRYLNIYRDPAVLKFYLSNWSHDNISDNAFSTFTPMYDKCSLVFMPSYDNNFNIHPEVNANIYHALLDSHLEEYINKDLISASQAEEGFWYSYFYPDKYYSTFQFLSLLRKTNMLHDNFKKGMDFVKTAVNDDGSWGEKNDARLSSIALNILCLSKDHSTLMEKSVNFLLQNQHSDGSWHTPLKVWEFYDNDGDIWQAFDIHNVIATSSVVESFKKYLIRISQTGAIC